MNTLCEDCGDITKKKAEHTASDGKKVCRDCNRIRLAEEKIQRNELIRRAKMQIEMFVPAFN